MKTSILIAAILLVSIFTYAQQSKTESKNFDDQLIKTNIESSDQTNNTVNLFDKHTIYKPVFKTGFSEEEFDPVQFSTKLSDCVGICSTGNLMITVKETLSHSGNLMFINKKYNYTTGMTGKGVGVKLRL